MSVSITARISSKSRPRKAFTLIEMIGVLAIIAILVAAVAPRIFEAIGDSKVTSLSTMVKTVQSAATKYYADVGSLYPLSAAGVGVADATGTLLPPILTGTTAAPAGTPGLWRKVRGPYMDQFNLASPPMGTSMTMPAVAAANLGAANAANNTSWDLNGDGNNDFTNATQVVSMTVLGISQDEFSKIDAMLDDGVPGVNTTSGKVKWAAAGGGTLRIYIADK